MKATQEVKNIKIKDLVLWTENPRDPINAHASDQDITDRAMEDVSSKWSLPKLAKDMGEYYDFSELPTVVYHGKKPVVYDGNRRMILGKISLGYVKIDNSFDLPEFPLEIPCNVCDKKTALQNVYRKHIDTGSWLPLERDIFLSKHMGKEKSTFLILEEATGMISANPHLNQRFVKEEILKEDVLKALGFDTQSGKLKSVHADQEAQFIFSDISKKIKDKQITTRNHRGKVFEVLAPKSQKYIDQNKDNRLHVSHFKVEEKPKSENKAQSKRTKKKELELFGGKLYLKMGNVSNLYRDITDLYQFYISNRHSLSQSFPGIIRMSLRLLCETAAKEDNNKKIENYLRDRFESAKKTLDQNIKTTLAAQNVNELTIVQLLHTGAHTYHSTNNFEQTLAVSIAVGAIITTSHGKDSK